MNPMNLKNNALFLSCWYERSRPVQIICFVILILNIMLLSFLIASSHETRPEVIGQSFFYVIVGLQAVVLLVQGAMFAGHMGSRERTSETLDFHRNSPEPVAAKIFGLIFGSAWFEWIVFFIFFVLELPFTLLPNISINQILLLNLSFTLSGIFYHTSWVAISLSLTKKEKGISLAALLLFIFLGIHFFFCYLTLHYPPFLSHLFGLTAFQYIADNKAIEFNELFYTLEIPFILMQAIMQIPLFLLMINGMRRTFLMPNSPTWSKKDALCFCGFIFFMITGLFMGNYFNLDSILSDPPRYGFYYPPIEGFFSQEAYIYSELYVCIGIMISFFCVPSYSKRSKYIVLNRSGLIKNRAMFDDGATSLFALISYALIGGMFFVLHMFTAGTPILNGIASFMILNSYVLAFAGFLEFFRLGRFRKNKIFLITTISVFWLFIPWMISFLDYNIFDYIHPELICPLWGLEHAVSLLLNKHTVNPAVLIIPSMIAVFTWILARRENSLVESRAVAAICNDPS